jgi:hypothetical protein
MNDQLLGIGTRVLLFPLREGQGAVGLEIAMRRVGHAHLRLEAPGGPAEPGGGGPKGLIEEGGDIEGKSHPGIEELRLALSKKHFCDFTDEGKRPDRALDQRLTKLVITRL